MKESSMLDFPIPYYGQDQTHKDSYNELCHCYSIKFKRKPPKEYSENNYLLLFEAVMNNTFIEKRKPRKCLECGGKVATILYGMPNMENLQLQKDLDDKKVILRGCCQPLGGAVWQCVDCNTQYSREQDVLEAFQKTQREK